jgi:hypothetical protein
MARNESGATHGIRFVGMAAGFLPISGSIAGSAVNQIAPTGWSEAWRRLMGTKGLLVRLEVKGGCRGRVFAGAPVIQEFDVLADKSPESSSGEPVAKALLFTFATANDRPN